jgi:hypothetical protein
VEDLVCAFGYLARDLDFKFVGRGIPFPIRIREFLTNPFFDLIVDSVKILRRQDAFTNELIFPALEWIALLKVLQFATASIKFLIVAAGMTRETFHPHP